MNVAADQLRDLLFEAESQHKAALGGGGEQHVAAAKSALLQLQALLSARAVHSRVLQQQAAGLLDDCSARLASLRVHESRTEARFCAVTPVAVAPRQSKHKLNPSFAALQEGQPGPNPGQGGVHRGLPVQQPSGKLVAGVCSGFVTAVASQAVPSVCGCHQLEHGRL